MNGALVIDKPKGLTSHDVVARARRLLKTKRVGHTGTLDPFATGVLVLLVGQATRLAQFVDKDEKEYEAVVRFGFETDTGDRTGSPRSNVQGPKPLEVRAVESVLAEFRGETEQVPPMYSAKKVAGKKLYELAREGQEIAREPSKVLIRELEILNSDQIRDPRSEIRIRVVCSAGTYIRTLAEDIGRKLGVGAHLQELRRTRAGRFSLSQRVTLEQLGSLDDPASILFSMSEIVSHLPAAVLSAERIEKTKNGMPSRIAENYRDGEQLRIVDECDELIAIGTFDEAERSVRPRIVLV